MMTSSALLFPHESIGGSSMFPFDGPDMESPPNSDSSSGCSRGDLDPLPPASLIVDGDTSLAAVTTPTADASEPAAKRPASGQTTTKARQKGKPFSRASTSKSEAINLTLQWLSDNYEQTEGMCLPRSVLYTHYLDFCKGSGLTPVSAASFGKVIRQKFPNLTTRRLGTRGQSKYHYYGIGIKETSPYYNTVYSRKGLTRFSATSGNTTRREYGNSLYSPSSKSGTLLPEFPTIKSMQFSSSVVAAKVETFLVMYRTHCQRILDTMVRAYFLEVQDFLIHFWRGMPTHLVSLMAAPAIVELVAMCDIITYQAVIEVLIPSNLQPLPESFSQDIREFSRQLPCWLGQAMAELPDALQSRKLEVAKNFCGMLRRQTSLVHLAQASRGILRNCDVVSQLLQDWRGIDFDPVHLKLSYAVESIMDAESSTYFSKSVTSKFEQLFVKQAPLETYFEWMDSLVESRTQNSEDAREVLMQKGELIRQWSLFGAAISRDMTLRSSPSFGSFHLLNLLLTEYLLCLVESLQQKNVEHQLQASLATQQDIQVSSIKAEPLQYLTPLGTPTITPGQHPSDVFNFAGGRNGHLQASVVGSGYLTSPSLYGSSGMAEMAHSSMDMTAMHEAGRFSAYPPSSSLDGSPHLSSADPMMPVVGMKLQHMTDSQGGRSARGLASSAHTFSSLPNIQQMSVSAAQQQQQQHQHQQQQASSYGYSSGDYCSGMQGLCKPEPMDSGTHGCGGGGGVPTSMRAGPGGGSGMAADFHHHHHHHAAAAVTSNDYPAPDYAQAAMAAWPAVDEHQMTASSVSLHSMAMNSSAAAAAAGPAAKDLAFMSVSSHDLAARSYPSLDPIAIATAAAASQSSAGPYESPLQSGLASAAAGVSGLSAASSYSHPNISRLTHGSLGQEGAASPTSRLSMPMHGLSQGSLLH